MRLSELLLSEDPVTTLFEMSMTGELKSFLPELAALDIKDDDSHKHKNNLRHSILVLGNAISMETTPDLVLRTASLLHDIGKPATREFDKDGNPTFHGHEVVGAKLVKPILVREGYSKEEIRLIVTLIANHMRSYNFNEELWTDSGVRRFNVDLGNEEQVKRILILFKADITTKFDTKRNEIFTKVDALARRVEEVKKLDARAALRPALDGYEVMEILGLSTGPELGKVMKFLNSDTGVKLSRDEAIEAIHNL